MDNGQLTGTTSIDIRLVLLQLISVSDDTDVIGLERFEDKEPFACVEQEIVVLLRDIFLDKAVKVRLTSSGTIGNAIIVKRLVDFSKIGDGTIDLFDDVGVFVFKDANWGITTIQELTENGNDRSLSLTDGSLETVTIGRTSCIG